MWDLEKFWVLGLDEVVREAFSEEMFALRWGRQGRAEGAGRDGTLWYVEEHPCFWEKWTTGTMRGRSRILPLFVDNDAFIFCKCKGNSLEVFTRECFISNTVNNDFQLVFESILWGISANIIKGGTHCPSHLSKVLAQTLVWSSVWSTENKYKHSAITSKARDFFHHPSLLWSALAHTSHTWIRNCHWNISRGNLSRRSTALFFDSWTDWD